MDSSTLKNWRFVAALLLSVYLSVCHAQQCNENDGKALLDFLAGFTPRGFFNFFESWKAGTNCCEWSGVNCTSTGQVQELIISNPNLHGGPSPVAERNPDYNGTLGATPGDLSELRRLDLSYMLFNGPMPNTFDKLKKLEQLNLFYNNFSGSLSPSIGGATALRILDASGITYFLSNPGIRPSPIPSSFCQLRNLEVLRLTSFSLTGDVRVQLECFCEFSQLATLDLSFNNLEGGIPSCVGTNLGKLDYLSLATNKLTGQIPSEMDNLSNLSYPYLSGNSLSGVIPSSIGNLAQLTVLDVSNNMLEGSLPAEIGRCGSSTSPGSLLLDVSNNRLSGSIPDVFGSGIPFNFDASQNSFTAGFPLTLASLRFVNVSHNSLSDLKQVGTLPPTPGVQYLDLNHNEFSGLVPSWLTDLVTSADLTILDVSSNKLTGPVPAAFFKVWNVNGSYNQFTGQLANNSSSGLLDFSHNGISGPITSEFIGSLLNTTSLLDLSFNQLSGSLPANIGDFQNLRYLDLSDNQLTGEVPDSVENIPNLEYLDLSNNGFTGRVPHIGPAPTPATTPAPV